MVERSPFAPAAAPFAHPVRGVRLAVAEAGIKYAGRTDVLLIALDPGTRVAGVFTRSRCASAPVEWCREKLTGGEARALLVNSGNANAFTGMKGREAVRLSAQMVSDAMDVSADHVFLASTGVIGEPLDAHKFDSVLQELSSALTADAWGAAAEAIMTTDTFPKVASTQIDCDGELVTLTGIAKGAGMIEPDMATMLSFVATDATIAPGALQKALKAAVDQSFNRITVDSDTSTSDTVLAFATAQGLTGRPIADEDDPRWDVFCEALRALCTDLAQQVVKDGEGLSKFVTVKVTGAADDRSADRIARSIANSPLVKTAFAGEDANWGRVVMAVGKAGEPADRDKLSIWFGDVRVAHEGERDPAYREDAASLVMKQPEITLRVDVGIGEGHATVWTCDLTKAYVAINGDYRT